MKLNSDQQELRDVVRRFLEEHVTPEYRRSRIDSGERSDPKLAGALEELGLTDGFRGESPMFTSVELGLLSFEAGRVLLSEPACEHLAGAFVAPRYIPAVDRDRLRAVAGDATKVAIVPAACCSVKVENNKASGSVTWSNGIEGARYAIVPSTTGVGALVDLTARGVRVAPCTSLDLTAALCAVTLSDAPVTILGAEASECFQAALDLTRAAEAAGLCSKVLEMTVDYVKTREQFGVPVGGFQSIQHKLADAYAQSEALRALAQFAAWSFAHDPSQRLLVAHAAAAYAGTVAPKICEAALQAHGGIGFTWEYDLHLYLRRAKLIESGFGLNESRAKAVLAEARA